MTHYIVKFLLALGLAVLVYSIGMPGCSPTQFGSLKTVSCEDFSARFTVESCEPISLLDPLQPLEQEDSPKEDGHSGQQKRTFTPREPSPPPKDLLEFNYRVSLGKVDIIFVIDNSSSMAKEHRSLASQFNSFLNNIRNVDYHIAVITTDISSSPKNPVRNAYYQDGKFIPIGRRVYLRNENLGHRPSSGVVEDFKRAIVREETTRCDTSKQSRSSSGNQYDDLYKQSNFNPSTRCPSHDERGTYALNLAVRNQRHRSFFRSDDAHLMIVILSDEDVRSSKEDYITQLGFDQTDHYAFEDFDYPEVLVESIKNRFPLKSFSVYPIIVIPGDSRCLNEQNRERSQGEGTGRGFYGVEYARLGKARDPALKQHGNLLKGMLISICDRNYGSQLNKVAVEANTIKITLPCGNPESVDLFVNGQRVRVSHTIEERTLIIEPGKMNLGSDIKVRVRCEAE